MCADVAFHDKGDGNPHAHILLTMRPLTPDGKWGDKSRLEYILDADGNRIPAKQKERWKTRKVYTTDWDDRGNAERWRAAAADAINGAVPSAVHLLKLNQPCFCIRQANLVNALLAKNSFVQDVDKALMLIRTLLRFYCRY